MNTGEWLVLAALPAAIEMAGCSKRCPPSRYDDRDELWVVLEDGGNVSDGARTILRSQTRFTLLRDGAFYVSRITRASHEQDRAEVGNEEAEGRLSTEEIVEIQRLLGTAGIPSMDTDSVHRLGGGGREDGFSGRITYHGDAGPITIRYSSGPPRGLDGFEKVRAFSKLVHGTRSIATKRLQEAR